MAIILMAAAHHFDGQPNRQDKRRTIGGAFKGFLALRIASGRLFHQLQAELTDIQGVIARFLLVSEDPARNIQGVILRRVRPERVQRMPHGGAVARVCGHLRLRPCSGTRLGLLAGRTHR